MVAIIHIHKHKFTSCIWTHSYNQHVCPAVYRHRSTLGKSASMCLGRTMKLQKLLSNNPHDSSFSNTLTALTTSLDAVMLSPRDVQLPSEPTRMCEIEDFHSSSHVTLRTLLNLNKDFRNTCCLIYTWGKGMRFLSQVATLCKN